MHQCKAHAAGQAAPAWGSLPAMPHTTPGSAPGPAPRHGTGSPPRRRTATAQRRTALVMLACAAPLLLAAQWLRLDVQDGHWLLRAAGTPVDLAGHAQAGWQALQRATGACQAVQQLPADSAGWQATRQALAAFSPPASQGARPLQLLAQAQPDGSQWLLAEVVWDAAPAAPPAAAAATAPLDPAIVVLQARPGQAPQVHPRGVWSGDTGPWLAPVFIRRWLQQAVPALPPALVLCLQPQWPVFSGAGVPPR